MDFLAPAPVEKGSAGRPLGGMLRASFLSGRAAAPRRTAMRSVARSVRTVLVLAAALFMPAAPGVRAAAVPAGEAQTPQASMSDRAKFVGTYRLLTTEV